MNSRDFCFWLQGMFELTEPKSLDEKQVELIRRHLNMVFIHEIDPSFPSEQQQALNQAHATNGGYETSPPVAQQQGSISTNHGIPTEPGVRC